LRQCRLILWVLMALVLFCTPALADKIVLKSGRTIKGYIAERRGNQCRIRMQNGASMILSVDEIDQVEKGITEVTLKDGRTGRLVMAAGDEVMLELKSGTRLRVTKDEVARMEEKVVVEKVEPVQPPAPPGEAPSAVRTVEVPSLKSALRELLRETVPERFSPGVIAKTVGEDVYVSVGSLDGILIGDRLNVVRKGAERDSVGELEVTSVQPRLAVCRLVRGNAEQKSPAGEFNQVVLSEQAGAVCVSIGAVMAAEAAGVSVADLREAIADACAAHPRLRYSERPVLYEVAAEASETPQGCSISLAVVERPGGRRVLQGKTSYRSKINLAELGYQSALIAELPAPPRLDATRSALVRLGVKPHDAGAGLFAPRIGAKGEDAWLLPGGAIIVASREALSNSSRMDALQATWKQVADATAGVTAAIDRKQLDSSFRNTVQFYTPKGGDFQLLIGYTEDGTWVLDWPAARPVWAALVAYYIGSLGWEKIHLAGRTFEQKNRWITADLTGLPHGEHKMEVERGFHLTIAAFFSTAGPRILLRDLAGTPKTNRNVFSEKLDSIYVPASEAYCTFR